MICNCCGCNNAPMARHRGYLICDDCVEKYGSYDAAALICLARNTSGLDLVPEELLDELDELYEHYMKMNFPDKAGGGRGMKIAYICDKKKKCAGTRGCGGEFCNHTLDPNHALNGICEDPEHDSRFRDRGNGYFEEILQQED